MEQKQLEQKIIESWGSLIRPTNLYPEEKYRLINRVAYGSLTDDNILYLLHVLLKTSGSSGGGFSVHFDNYDIFRVVRNKLYNVNSLSRKIKPILRCYDFFFLGNTGENEGQWSLAVMYLIAELERYTRINNIYTDNEGVITKEFPEALQKILKRKKEYIVSDRVNKVGDMIQIYCYENDSPFSIYLKNFDSQMILYEETLSIREDKHSVIEGVKVPAIYNHWNIIERINETRNSVMHGQKQADSDIFLFLTLHATIFMNDQHMYDEY